MKYDQKYYTLTKSNPCASRIHHWRFEEGTAAFKDINIYILGKFLKY